MPRKDAATVAPPRSIMRPPILFERTQALIARIAARLPGPLLTYWNSPNGSVCHNDVVALNEILAVTGRHPTIHLLIKSDGGNGRAALRMIHLLRQRCRRLVALVPLNAESAATMLALGADEIRMGAMAFLTPVDTSIRHDLSPIDKDNDRVSVGQNELARIIRLWRRENAGYRKNPYEPLWQHVHPLVIGAVDRASSLSTMLCDEILAYHLRDAAKRRRIARSLNADYPSHGYPIVRKEARRLGLNATELAADIERDLIELNGLYAEMGQHCRTDFDERHHHDNDILNILEGPGAMTYYQIDKDWHYRESERTWVFTNERSRWHLRRNVDGQPVDSVLHIR